ncbi:MAG: MarR family winged helix-turn-helix transcriptional regulator [Sphingomicrobium sp.]
MKELAWEIGETYRSLRRYYDRRAAALGVTTAQWRVLAWLGHSPGLKQVELAERLDVEPITAGRIIDRLEEAGLVERQPDPVDRRAWRLMLTAKAGPIIARLTELAEEMSDEAFADFDVEELEAMRTRLARMRSNIGRAEAAMRKSA